MIKAYIYSAALVLFIAGNLEAVQVSLRSGSRIQAPVLKKSDDYIVPDL